MSHTSKKKRKLKELHDFHNQNRTCGGLVDMHIIQRRDAPDWAAWGIFDEKNQRIVEALDGALNRWDREGAGLMCLTCDNSVERIGDIEAFVILTTYGGVSDNAMTCPLCRACANHPDMETRVMGTLKEKMWPGLRIAPPIHAEAGHA